MGDQLFKPPAAALESLTPRQRFAYDLLSKPRTDKEVGMWLHAARHAGIFPPPSACSCYRGAACFWAAQSGRLQLSVLRGKGLTIRRRGGLWERSDGSSKPSSQGEDIPF